MDLDYNETMRRIDELKKKSINNRNYCTENSFPFMLNIYKGESQLIFVPEVKTIGWYSIEMAWHIVIKETNDANEIGSKIADSFAHIKQSPVDARTSAERKNDFFALKSTSCKNYKSLYNKYLHCEVTLYENGEITISGSVPMHNGNALVALKDTEIHLTTFDLDTLGSSVLKCFTHTELLRKKEDKKEKYPPKVIDLLCQKKVMFQPPRDSNFIDNGDSHSAEIYQSYSYLQNNNSDEYAIFYIGIAAELNCDTSYDNIYNVWNKMYGDCKAIDTKQGQFGIFDLRIEVTNVELHRISYLKKMTDSELLECTMELYFPNKRKKMDSKLTGLFESFSKGIILMD